MAAGLKRSYYRRARKIVPICIFLGMGYYNFACLYRLGYQEIYKYHSRGVAIGLWILGGFCQVCVYAYWLVILIHGPGMSPKIEPFDIYGGEVNSIPQYFLCDEQGFPYWCTSCESIKTPRALHLNDKNCCVPKFDHYCVWIGAVIGRDNYNYFIKFCLWYDVLFVITIIFLARYIRSNINRGTNLVDNNYILLYIFSGFWIVMILGLLMQHIYYISINVTTVERLNLNLLRRYNRWKQSSSPRFKFLKERVPKKEDGKRYINVANKGSRAVLCFSINQNIFSHGLKKNWINQWTYRASSYSNKALLKSLLFATIPLFDILRKPQIIDSTNLWADKKPENVQIFEKESEELGPYFQVYIDEQILKGNYRIPSYLNYN